MILFTDRRKGLTKRHYDSYKTYYLFGLFNAISFVHMFLTAHETKGFTLEEMDSVFESGRPAWKSGGRPARSRLDELETRLEAAGADKSRRSVAVCEVPLTPVGETGREIGL
ncbi:hypothetical protein CDD80_1302 [Ophiocordyceps camponoti-rufipedis]|uniref:Uncharacterized protein n=1 Tax=Ophiocordyceps camponoti-rufipedis TaxID=2004952 RepID=A0A2C5X9E9_9HYPO|nr:hypothetical protein CDD80_1302 [Ophiocordyceps camponoti-rufipedis]